MTFWKWSRTASANATADSTCPFPEGMAPSAVNDGVRGAMAAAAKHRDDIAGAIVTGGTSTAYTVSSYQVFDSFAHMDGAMIAFTPHATNGATVTLNIDGLGAKPLRSAQGVELLAGTLIQTAPYVALYNSTDAAWYLHGFFGQVYSVPLLGCVDYFGITAPNSSFIFPRGQALSRTTYAAAFAIMGTTYGSGDGSTTFNVPDLGGRVRVMTESLASRLTSSFFGGNSTVMGATGGAESTTLTTAQLPAHSHANTLSDPTHTHVLNAASSTTSAQASNTGGGLNVPAFGGTANNAATGISINNVNAGSGAAHASVQPTICCGCIMRVL
jgi:microcystin-dependent protein